MAREEEFFDWRLSTVFDNLIRTSVCRSQHIYEVRPRADKRGVDLTSDALPFGRLWYGEPDAITSAISYAKFFSRSQDAVIRVYDDAGNVIQAHEHKGDFSKW
ncbi:MAG TPA: hypothetical protein VIW07_18040 [Candidatus Udaeobacter sp.]